MASNDTLYGLAAHLQTMENNLTDFIFHCALRLSAMTDSRVFLLMDNPNAGGLSRRFCGNRDLVEEFVSRGLRVRSSVDVEIELNGEEPTVRPKQQQQQQQNEKTFIHHREIGLDQMTSNADRVPPAGFNNLDNAIAGRFLANGTPATSSSSKKRPPDSVDASANEFGSNASSKRRRSEEDVVDASTMDGKNHPSPSIDCKTEVEEFLIDSDSDNDGDTSTSERVNQRSLPAGAGAVGERNGYHHNNSLLDASSYLIPPYSNSEVVEDVGSSSSFIADDVEDDDGFITPSRRVGLDIPNLAMKERAVARLDDPVRAFVKGSMENKLLASICYDVGKAVTLTNPFPVGSQESRDHFKDRINAYVLCYPTFLNVAVTPEMTALFNRESSIQAYTPDAFMKMNARNGFKRAAKAREKGQGPGK